MRSPKPGNSASSGSHGPPRPCASFLLQAVDWRSELYLSFGTSHTPLTCSHCGSTSSSLRFLQSRCFVSISFRRASIGFIDPLDCLTIPSFYINQLHHRRRTVVDSPVQSELLFVNPYIELLHCTSRTSIPAIVIRSKPLRRRIETSSRLLYVP
jgi:hypothetical protein